MSTPRTAVSVEQLLRMPDTGSRYELARGELIEKPPAGARHGHITSRIDGRLGNYVEETGAGKVFTADTGFVLERGPDTVRAPDVAFVSEDRLPRGELPSGFLEMAPDLAVEVVSPSDSADQVQEKMEQWMRHGVRLAWLVYPATRSVAVYRALDDVRILTGRDVLSGEPVIPGFSRTVEELF